jgi:hypothetical protein
MLHEVAHAPATRRGIKDTSAADNRYHNKRFAALAAELGLRGPDVPDKVTSWSHCTLHGQAAYDAWAEVTAGIDAARLPFLPDMARLARPGGEDGPILCGLCRAPFERPTKTRPPGRRRDGRTRRPAGSGGGSSRHGGTRRVACGGTRRVACARRARQIRPGLRLVLPADPGPGAAGRGVLFGAVPAGPAPVPAHHRPRRTSRGVPAAPAGLGRPALPRPGQPVADHPATAAKPATPSSSSAWPATTGGRCPPPPNEALPAVPALCPARVRVAAWHRGARPAPARWPLHAWEPVLYYGGRQLTRRPPGTTR